MKLFMLILRLQMIVLTGKNFNEVKIYIITGKFNAAIARNIGAKEAKGDVFFIDGDMEILPDFLPLVYNEKWGLNSILFLGK